MICFSKFPVDVVPFGQPKCCPLFYINRGILSKWDTTVAALSQTELYKYDWRIDLFLKKFSGKEEFELNSGKMVKFVYDKKTADLVSKKKDIKTVPLVGTDDKLYKFTDLKKNKEFGGGGGSGAGADVTKLGESAQAVFAQAKWASVKQYTKEDIKKAYAKADTDEKLANIETKLTGEWRASSILGAEELYKEFKGKQYTFHRGSAWVDKLQNHWKKLNQQEKLFTNINKWSPADIYMVSAAGARVDLTKAKNIADLNNMMIENLKSKDIIGVSLKIMKDKSHLSYYNFGAKKKVIKYQDYTTGTQGFFGGKDVYIYFTVDGKIQFRTFPETFQGEIKGKNANQGKLSYGPIQTILRTLKAPMLTDVRPLRDGLTKADSKIYQEFYDNYKKYAKDTTKVDFSEFVSKCQEKGVSWCFSKFLGCQLVNIIKTKKMEDDFVTACISYASSSSDLSAPFVKVE